MRTLRLLLLGIVPTMLLLSACGGGGSPDAALFASLTGEVLEVDGRTDALAGVSLSLLETGAVAVTGSDGRFDFGPVPSGTVTLALFSPAAAASHEGPGQGSGEGPGPGPGGPGEGDGSCPEEGSGGNAEGGPQGYTHGQVEDGENAWGRYMTVYRAKARERIHLRLRIRDEAVQEMQCIREQHRECEVEVVLTAAPGLDDEDLAGKLELESRDDRERIKVYVEKAEPGRDLEVVVVAPDDAEESLGTRTGDAAGEAAWVVDTSQGDLLPFLAAEVADLAGYRVEVRDADTEAALLETLIPAMPPFFGEGPGHGARHGWE